MKSRYMENVADHISKISKKSMGQGGQAWENAKVKAHNRHIPRGRVWGWLFQMEWTQSWARLTEGLGDMKALAAEIKEKRKLSEGGESLDKIMKKAKPFEDES